ncbi:MULTISPECIES: hypothetical protein [Caproicibacterium]|uniref:Uncharacterized protein n=1 Tax=Caproicibacterium argilliputei TaxID=3030016 RepID=A0AA97DCB0_9FIRM|nr:hypothetical protein [Caproicibacterium argilliputei]WOC32826.1 hypothetical protein PXC00_02825 [Caproicibacterium argilliputei]
MPTDKLVRALPDAYRKDFGGNNYKLLALHAEAVDALRADIQAVLQAQNLQQAIGKTLDLYGAEVGQPRGSADDTLYRVLIQQKMARNRGIGTWESVTGGVRNVLNCGASDFYVYDNSYPHKAVLRVRNEEVLENCPLPTEEMKRVLNQLLPAGVDFVTVIPFPGSSFFAVCFRPVRLRIKSKVNIWHLNPVYLNGMRRLDGSWVLNQEVREHFLLAQMQVSSLLSYHPGVSAKVGCQSRNLLLLALRASKLRVYNCQKIPAFSNPIQNVSRSTQKVQAAPDFVCSAFSSQSRFSAALTAVPMWHSFSKTAFRSTPKDTAVHSNQIVSVQTKIIRKITNPVWTLNGAYHLSFSVSIDGNKQLHDSCRVFPDGSGSYDKAIKAVQHFRTKLHGDMGSKMTLAPGNIRYTCDAVKNLIALDYNQIFLNCVYEKGWTQEHAKILYQQLKELADYLLENSLEDEIYLSIFEEFIGHKMKSDDNENWCGGTGYMIAVDYKGDIFPCLRYMESSLGEDVPPVVIGNVHDGIMATPDQCGCVHCMKCVTRRSQSTDECFNCPIAQGCAWCSAYNYQEFGTMNHRATYICEMHKARILANVYFWNKKYQKHGESRVFRNNVPTEWALRIIDKKELDMLNQLAKENE